MKARVVAFIGLFLLMLVTGVFWGTWFTLTRSIETFSAAEFIHIEKTIIANVVWPMRILMPSCILVMILSVWFCYERKSPGLCLGVAAVFLIIIALLITLLVEVPIDNQIKTWTASTVPLDWEAIRGRWQFFHSARTFISLASFASLTLAILFSKSGDELRSGLLMSENLLTEMGKYNNVTSWKISRHVKAMRTPTDKCPGPFVGKSAFDQQICKVVCSSGRKWPVDALGHD